MDLNFSQLVDGLSVNLYSAASNMTTDGNVFVSPISIVYATMLVYLGSKGTTKSNIESAFNLNTNQAPDLTIQPFATALSKLKSRESASEGDLVLKIANSIFLKTSLNLEPAYQKAAQSQLEASINLKDFVGNAEGSRNEINAWVEEKTNNKIKDLLPSGSIDASTVSVLVNAVYFKAAWDEKFPESGTKQEDFKLLDGSTKKTDLMHLKDERFNYVEDADLDVQYLEIPYQNQEASLLVLLPRKVNGLRALEKALKKDTFSKLFSKVRANVKVDLTLPKFKIESTFDAKKLLQSVGVTDIFSEKADLSEIVAGQPVVISEAFHKTFIEVDEKGTEAAAATAMKAVPLSLMVELVPTQPVVFKADHPFLFAIRHNPTKLILFVGRLEKF